VEKLDDAKLVAEALEKYGPCLRNAKIDLREVYDVWRHRNGATVIGTKPVEIPSLTPFSQIPYTVRHSAFTIVHDGGVEVVNVGLVGEVDEGEVVVRMESFCPPAFLFGSQKCNCADQWAVAREMAGRLKRGFALVYLDAQAGMGAGNTEGVFAPDLYARAVMRQMGESSLGLSIAEGYEQLGIARDGREGFGYEVPAIVLSCLGVSKEVALMTNNLKKVAGFTQNGFSVRRIKLLGKISKEGFDQALQRKEMFGHQGIDAEIVEIEDEISRLQHSLK